MSTLEEWMTTVREELGLTGDGVADTKAVTTVILDLARDAAHAVARPAAPLTAYLVGVAVGQGASLTEAASRVAELASARQPSDVELASATGDRRGTSRGMPDSPN